MDLLLRGLGDFLPVRNPAGHPADGEDDGEHLGRDADGLEDDARVEVDVRVEVALLEVRVVERGFFEAHGDGQERVVDAEDLEDLVALGLDDLGPRVVVLVHAVTKAHQAHLLGLVLGVGNKLRAVVAGSVDFLEHLDDGLVGAAMQRTPEGADAGGDGREEVGAAGGDHADGRGGAVLLVVGVQQEDQVKRAGDFRVDGVIGVGLREEQVQEVGAVIETRLRVDGRLTFLGAVGERGEGADLRDQDGGGLVELGQVMRALVGAELGVVATKRIQRGGQDGHRVGVTREAAERDAQAFVDLGVVEDAGLEGGQLGGRRQFAVDEQIGGLDEVGLLSEFFDAVAAIAKDTLLAVDEGNLGLAGAGVGVAVVESDVAGLVAQLADVDPAFAFGTDDDGEDDVFTVQVESGVLSAHGGGGVAGVENTPQRADKVRKLR